MGKIILFILSIFIIENLSAEILTVTNINDSGAGSLRRMVEISIILNKWSTKPMIICSLYDLKEAGFKVYEV